MQILKAELELEEQSVAEAELRLNHSETLSKLSNTGKLPQGMHVNPYVLESSVTDTIKLNIGTKCVVVAVIAVVVVVVVVAAAAAAEVGVGVAVVVAVVVVVSCSVIDSYELETSVTDTVKLSIGMKCMVVAVVVVVVAAQYCCCTNY